MAEQASTVSQLHPQVTNRQEILKKLCSNGFSVVFETVVTLHRCELPRPTESEVTDGAEAANGSLSLPATSQEWQTVDYGIPAMTVEGCTLQLHIFDVNSCDTVRRFTLQTDSLYSELDAHFHAFIDCSQTEETDKVYCFGISTPDEAVAKKMLGAVKRILPLSDEQSLAEFGYPLPKRGRFDNVGESSALGDNEWVIIEPKDVPVAEAETKEERVEDDRGGSDDNETDSALSRLRAGKKRRRESQEKPRPTISDPMDVRHIAHVTEDTSISNMTKAMSVDIRYSQDISSLEPETGEQVGRIEPGTEETTSFVEVPKEDLPPPPTVAPPPPPPPPEVKKLDPVVFGKTGNSKIKMLRPQGKAVSLEEILQKRGTLRPVRGHKVVPEPPPKPDRTKLFTDINTFDRNSLKHVHHQNNDSIDQDDPNCLQSILKASLMKMREKLSISFPQVGHVNSEGDEEGFGDECDGPLFN